MKINKKSLKDLLVFLVSLPVLRSKAGTLTRHGLGATGGYLLAQGAAAGPVEDLTTSLATTLAAAAAVGLSILFSRLKEPRDG